ncbi:MAG: hypothetical protein JSU00_02830 [Acidobacteria bacterium]|nr:hypothetical protein [Acidobacteriota bacterium]
MPLLFGIYPGGAAGSDNGIAAGPPDDPRQIGQALTLLEGGAPFIVRGYERYNDSDAPSRWAARAPDPFDIYITGKRRLDLVLMFQSARGDVAGFLDFVRSKIRQYAPHLCSVQITEEANFTNGPDCIDGPYPRVLEALVQGVVAAAAELRSLNRPGVRAGFNSTPTFGASQPFWDNIATLAGPRFYEALGYVGLDFFPDVFRPAPDIRAAALMVLETMRNVWLPAAKIPSHVPIHIAEHGWPTASDRPYDRQAEAIEIVIRTVHTVRQELNIERYTLFALRDASSAVDDIFSQFGVLTSGYTPKPAFETYRRLIAELGQSNTNSM